MPIVVYTGKPGAGKTLLMAKEALSYLRRNKTYFEKTGVKRKLFLNIKLSDWVEKLYPDYFSYWKDPRELVSLRDCDVFWDEMPTHLDSTEWANMSLELKRWLQQHRKMGIEIIGTAQSFSQVDISARRLVSELYWLTKIMGSRSPSATKPPPKWIWGLGTKRVVDPIDFDEKNPNFISFMPIPYFMGRKAVSTFDTNQLIEMGEYPPMKHIYRVCERYDHSDPDKVCDFRRVIHK